MLLSVSDVHQIINFLAAFLMLLIRTKGSIYIEQRAKAIINSAIFLLLFLCCSSPTRLALLDSPASCTLARKVVAKLQLTTVYFPPAAAA